MAGHPPPVGVVTALTEELHCLAKVAHAPQIHVVCGGVGPERAAKAARKLLAGGAGALVSFGIAGGLDPSLAPGTLVLADEIATNDGTRHATDPEWRHGLRAVLADMVAVVGGAMLGSDVVIKTPADKVNLYRTLGTVAVDMESHAVVKVAHEAGVPFLAVRVVSDPAAGLVPPSAIGAVTDDGRRRYGRVLSKLARRPQDLPALIRLGHSTARAKRTLVRVVELAGPSLGFAPQPNIP